MRGSLSGGIYATRASDGALATRGLDEFGPDNYNAYQLKTGHCHSEGISHSENQRLGDCYLVPPVERLLAMAGVAPARRFGVRFSPDTLVASGLYNPDAELASFRKSTDGWPRLLDRRGLSHRAPDKQMGSGAPDC